MQPDKDLCGGGWVGEADADAVDAAVGAGEDFEAKAIFFDDFAGEGDVAGDLGDEAAEGGGFVVLGKAEGGGVVAGVAESSYTRNNHQGARPIDGGTESCTGSREFTGSSPSVCGISQSVRFSTLQ